MLNYFSGHFMETLVKWQSLWTLLNFPLTNNTENKKDYFTESISHFHCLFHIYSIFIFLFHVGCFVLLLCPQVLLFTIYLSAIIYMYSTCFQHYFSLYQVDSFKVFLNKILQACELHQLYCCCIHNRLSIVAMKHSITCLYR